MSSSTATAAPSSSSSSSSIAPPPDAVWGCVELGGTTIKLALARGSPTNVVEQSSFETGDKPALAIEKAVKYFEDKQLTGFAIGSFGPVDLDHSSRTYGYITSTPKLAWQDFDVVGPFRRLGVPTGFNTDVNTAAWGELTLGGHGDEVRNVAYVTVGTGIGAGVVCERRVVAGMLHPEAGHILVRRHEKDEFKGLCPFHGDCLEGLATANAVAARLGIGIRELASLPDSHEVWDIESYYLAQLCVNLALIASPHVIVLGGGVLKRQSLFPRVRAHFTRLLNGYLRARPLEQEAERYIVPSRFDAPESHTSAGCVGTLAYAMHTWQIEQQRKRDAERSSDNSSSDGAGNKQ